MKTIVITLAVMLSALPLTAQTTLPRVAPEQVGMSSRQLMRADSVIQRAIAQGEIPGAVLAVVRQGKMAYLKAYGNKQVYPTVVPMKVNTVFDLASCTKPIATAVSAMILIERGKLRLTDRVSLYLPEFTDNLRIIDLMTHTSGLPAYAPTAELKKKYGSPCPAGLLTYIATCKREFLPGTAFKYSCLNYIALQHVIETLCGQSLRDFAKANIFEVLGMAHTDYLPTVKKGDRWVNISPCPWAARIAPTEKLSNGSVFCGQVHDPLARILNGGVSGNAGLFSDANDIALLAAALQAGGELNGHRILSPLSVQTMRTVPRDLSAFGRTPGWDCYSPYASVKGDLLGAHAYGHTGYTGTSVVIDPDNDLSIILLANRVHPKDKGSVVRLRSLVANAVAAAVRPTPQTYTEHYYHRFLQFEDEAPIRRNDLVMLGNSLTEGGGDWAGLQEPNVRNRGIIGDEVNGVLDGLHLTPEGYALWCKALHKVLKAK